MYEQEELPSAPVNAAANYLVADNEAHCLKLETIDMKQNKRERNGENKKNLVGLKNSSRGSGR